MKTHYIIICIVSLFCGAVGAWAVATYGYKLGLIDQPNERSSHRQATPKGGGIGILAGFVIASIALKMPAGFWVPAALLSMLSFIGDRLHLSPRFRLCTQFSLAIIFLLSLSLARFEHTHQFWVIIPLLIFIVGTANFYNFMDGIDGIAAITGLVGFGLLSYFSYFWGTSTSVTALSISVALGCLGFLPFNLPNAKVFLGDVGSILLGYLFASIVIWMSDNVLVFICLSSFLFPFYIDEVTTMLLRIKEKEKLTQAHRRHLYQILANEYELSHWIISLGYGLFQLVIGSSIFAIKDRGLSYVLSLLVFYACIFSAFSLFMRRKLSLRTAGIK